MGQCSGMSPEDVTETGSVAYKGAEMISTDHAAAERHPWWLLAGAKRAAERHRVLLAAAAVAMGGGAAAAALALTSSSSFQAAAVCEGASTYVYEVPSYPNRTPTAPAWPPGGNDYWGWMPRTHALRVGDRLRVNGALWQVAAIAALPGECKYFGVIGSPLGGGSLAGRLILRGPVG